MDRREQIEKDVLERYGVSAIEDLPIDYGAYVLQVSEDLSEPLFDEFYDGLDARYAGQESVVRSVSLFTPTIAASALSRGIAGTDRVHQREFARAAETHRRNMVQLLNEDYMYNAGAAGYSYTADEQLWAKFEEFDYRPPRLSQVAGTYAADLILLLAWIVSSVGFAYWSVQRAVVGEERT
jgi:ABC-2 type transport system permease protein